MPAYASGALAYVKLQGITCHPTLGAAGTARPPYHISISGQEQRLAEARGIRLKRHGGLTQIQLAKAAGTTQRAISYYENEAGFPPAPAVVAPARALQVSTDELLGIKPQPREISKLERLSRDPESRRLWKRFQKITSLPERDQRAVIRLINSLSSARGVEART